MSEEFCLSDKGIEHGPTIVYLNGDVYEFIKRLKEQLPEYLGTVEEEEHDIKADLIKVIDSLAGEALI